MAWPTVGEENIGSIILRASWAGAKGGILNIPGRVSKTGVLIETHLKGIKQD